jgi:tetratricopeptide (TPR) repeat protein
MPAHRKRSTLSRALSLLGRFDEAIGHAEAAVRIAEENDHPWTLFLGLLFLGWLHLDRGDFPRAARLLERSLRLGRGSSSTGHQMSPQPLARPMPLLAGLRKRWHWSRAPSRRSARVRVMCRLIAFWYKQ